MSVEEMVDVPYVDPSHLSAPYAQRWELLKEVMEYFFIVKKKEAKDMVEIMRSAYAFYATNPIHKNHFKKWKMRKSIPKTKKDKILGTLETRAQQGKSSKVSYYGREVVDDKNIRRYMKEATRKGLVLGQKGNTKHISIDNLSGHALQCGNRVFMNWSMPAAVVFSSRAKAMEHASPYSQPTPMSGVEISTPRTEPSPKQPMSPPSNTTSSYASSSMMLLGQDSLKISRTQSFILKDHMALMTGMNLDEQIKMTDWFHQYWLFAFRTARTWGRGPRAWDSGNLNFEQFIQGSQIAIFTPSGLDVSSPYPHSSHQSPIQRISQAVSFSNPDSRCSWGIHVGQMDYIRVSSPVEATDEVIDVDDEASWKPWSRREDCSEFVDSLQANIESNNFSNVDISDVPIDTNQLAKAVKRSPEQLLVEAFGFSIMARNLDLVGNMIPEVRAPGVDLNGIYPLHLAGSYLNGAKKCCQIFKEIVISMAGGEKSIRKLNLNHLNHTVLDNLMIAILKAHTFCTPGMVDDALKNESRFSGEEVDICGRFDADSDCIRQLQAAGHRTIPRTWKHMFCHTSAQAITHCIATLFTAHWGPDINAPSGIFIKRCGNETCGLKMRLKPLHTLVVTAVYLAHLGTEGETLFGMIACLLCLLSKGANPLLTAEISARALLRDKYSEQQCSHAHLDPLQLTQEVPKSMIDGWNEYCKAGWMVFCHVLRLSQQEWKPREASENGKVAEPTLRTPNDHLGIYTENFEDVGQDDMFDVDQSMNDEEADVHEDTVEEEDWDNEQFCERMYEEEHGYNLPAFCFVHEDTAYQRNYFRQNTYLATLWAAAQTELVTYRRREEGDPWISKNFNLFSVLASLETQTDLQIELVTGNMMNSFCRCGIFCDSDNVAGVRAEEASAHYFSNLDDWNRSTFLPWDDYYWEEAYWEEA